MNTFEIDHISAKMYLSHSKQSGAVQEGWNGNGNANDEIIVECEKKILWKKKKIHF